MIKVFQGQTSYTQNGYEHTQHERKIEKRINSGKRDCQGREGPEDRTGNEMKTRRERKGNR